MSMDMMANERVCYVHCNFCNTTLAVSVPCSSLLTVVTVRCGHCANLLSVNMGASSFQTFPPQQDPQKQHLISSQAPISSCKEYGASSFQTFPPQQDPQKQHLISSQAPISSCKEYGSSSSSNYNAFEPDQQPRNVPPIRPPEKRQRVPSAYNRFIKEEIQRIKAGNPDISHREAFSTAAKNWAHFPHIHFGLKLDASKQAKLDQGDAAQKSNGFY